MLKIIDYFKFYLVLYKNVVYFYNFSQSNSVLCLLYPRASLVDVTSSKIKCLLTLSTLYMIN